MLNTTDILETIRMIDDENLDIRTITMGISLLDCADSDIHASNRAHLRHSDYKQAYLGNSDINALRSLRRQSRGIREGA